MKKIIFKGAISALLASTLLGCATNKQGVGTGVGLVAGGLLGSQFGKGDGKVAAAVLGAGLGALVGGAIGKDLDDKDKQLMELSSQRALESAPSGNSTPWSNPDSGHHGYVTPTKTYQRQDGRYCREYTQVVKISGKSQTAYGTACRQSDGQWELMDK